MIEVIYNNAENINTSYILFKLNYGYHIYIFYKKILIFALS